MAPLIQELYTSNSSVQAKGTQRGRGSFPAAAKSDSLTARKTIHRRLNELERDNFHDQARIELKADLKKRSAAVKRILFSRKNLSNLLDEDENSARAYLGAASAPSKYPSRPLCSICGYWGDVQCTRCGARYCGLACQEAHQETRCLKFYA